MEYSVSIDIFNKTSTSKKLLVFGRNHHVPLTEDAVKEAWQVIPNIPAQGKATIHYPQATAVGVFYKENNSIISFGPHDAEPGTTWIYEEMADKAAFYKDTDETPLDTYVIFNKQPTASSGRKISVGLYKDGKPILVKHNVGVENYVEMKPSESLHFCCMESGNEGGDHIDFTAEFSPMSSVDLKNYHKGLDLIVEQNETTGRIIFVSEAKS